MNSARWIIPLIAIIAIILGVLAWNNQPIRNPEGLPACESVPPGTLCYLASENRHTMIPAAPSTPVSAPTVAASAAPTPAPSPTPAPTATAAAPVTDPPASAILPAVNLETEPVEGEPTAFILHWEYPEEGAVVPESFDVYVDGQLYESTSYQGTDFPYSWYVGDQPCSGPLDVHILAVNGADSAQSETIQWEGC